MYYRQYCLKILLFFGLMGCIATSSFAQISDVASILQSSKEDAMTLTEAYLDPFANGFGASLNTGWTNAAKPHSTLGFDITLSTGLAIVPEADKSFDVTTLGLQQLQYDSGPEVSQTINGSDETGSTLAASSDFDNDGQEEKFLELTLPQGTNFGYVPAPMVKAGVGLFKDTEVMVRYLPETEIGDFGSFNLYGVGAKHGINQWLPGGNLLPVNLSVMFGYTSMNVGANLNVTAEDVIQDPDNTANPYEASQWQGQSIDLASDAWTVNALVGKSLPVISVYAGVGYEASTLNITSPGSYPTVVPNENFDPNNPNAEEPFIVNAVDQPLDLSFEGDNSFRMLAGFRFRIAVLHISGSYTLSQYSSYNVGVGISFR